MNNRHSRDYADDLVGDADSGAAGVQLSQFAFDPKPAGKSNAGSQRAAKTKSTPAQRYVPPAVPAKRRISIVSIVLIALIVILLALAVAAGSAHAQTSEVGQPPAFTWRAYLPEVTR